jgi:sulfur relay (sulfurtransferase) DsrF/TusC family protein
MLGELEITKLDYSEAKELYSEESLYVLPAFLFENKVKENSAFSDIEKFTKNTANYISLEIGATFNPNAEICNNGVDDTGDGLADCEDSACKGTWECMEKVDVPKVELFIMSHCPYGTQMEKGMLPVAKLLGDKIDFQLKFVNYAMHDEKEVVEQANQYCIEKEYGKAKLLDYVECFLSGKSGSAEEGKTCMNKLSISETKISSCFDTADKEFSLLDNVKNKAGRFPAFNIHAEDNVKYGVKGSPHLVVNGAQPSAGRDSASILNVICSTFKEKPAECSETLSSTPPSPGFGYEGSGSATAATCG